MYESCKDVLFHGQKGILESAISGMHIQAKLAMLGLLSSGISSALTHPFDVLKTRMQLQPTLGMREVMLQVTVIIILV